MEKLYARKSLLKSSGRMHILHPSPLAISYRNYQESGRLYFSHLALLILFSFTKKQSQKGGPMA